MVFQIKVPSALLRRKTKQQVDDDSISTSSTIAPSKSRAAINSFLSAFSTEKYLNDPMRTTNRPEVVGYYYDPMSCGSPRVGHVVSNGYDCTNTGA